MCEHLTWTVSWNVCLVHSSSEETKTFLCKRSLCQTIWTWKWLSVVKVAWLTDESRTIDSSLVIWDVERGLIQVREIEEVEAVRKLPPFSPFSSRDEQLTLLGKLARKKNRVRVRINEPNFSCLFTPSLSLDFQDHARFSGSNWESESSREEGSREEKWTEWFFL